MSLNAPPPPLSWVPSHLPGVDHLSRSQRLEESYEPDYEYLNHWTQGQRRAFVECGPFKDHQTSKAFFALWQDAESTLTSSPETMIKIANTYYQAIFHDEESYQKRLHLAFTQPILQRLARQGPVNSDNLDEYLTMAGNLLKGEDVKVLDRWSSSIDPELYWTSLNEILTCHRWLKPYMPSTPEGVISAICDSLIQEYISSRQPTSHTHVEDLIWANKPGYGYLKDWSREERRAFLGCGIFNDSMAREAFFALWKDADPSITLYPQRMTQIAAMLHKGIFEHQGEYQNRLSLAHNDFIIQRLIQGKIKKKHLEYFLQVGAVVLVTQKRSEKLAAMGMFSPQPLSDQNSLFEFYLGNFSAHPISREDVEDFIWTQAHNSHSLTSEWSVQERREFLRCGTFKDEQTREAFFDLWKDPNWTWEFEPSEIIHLAKILHQGLFQHEETLQWLARLQSCDCLYDLLIPYLHESTFSFSDLKNLIWDRDLGVPFDWNKWPLLHRRIFWGSGNQEDLPRRKYLFSLLYDLNPGDGKVPLEKARGKSQHLALFRIASILYKGIFQGNNEDASRRSHFCPSPGLTEALKGCLGVEDLTFEDLQELMWDQEGSWTGYLHDWSFADRRAFFRCGTFKDPESRRTFFSPWPKYYSSLNLPPTVLIELASLLHRSIFKAFPRGFTTQKYALLHEDIAAYYIEGNKLSPSDLNNLVLDYQADCGDLLRKVTLQKRRQFWQMPYLKIHQHRTLFFHLWVDFSLKLSPDEIIDRARILHSSFLEKDSSYQERLRLLETSNGLLKSFKPLLKVIHRSWSSTLELALPFIIPSLVEGLIEGYMLNEDDTEYLLWAYQPGHAYLQCWTFEQRKAFFQCGTFEDHQTSKAFFNLWKDPLPMLTPQQLIDRARLYYLLIFQHDQGDAKRLELMQTYPVLLELIDPAEPFIPLSSLKRMLAALEKRPGAIPYLKDYRLSMPRMNPTFISRMTIVATYVDLWPEDPAELEHFLKVLYCFETEKLCDGINLTLRIFKALSHNDRVQWPSTEEALFWMHLLIGSITEEEGTVVSQNIPEATINLAAEVTSLLLAHNPPPFDCFITISSIYHPTLQELHTLLSPPGSSWQERLAVFTSMHPSMAEVAPTLLTLVDNWYCEGLKEDLHIVARALNSRPELLPYFRESAFEAPVITNFIDQLARAAEHIDLWPAEPAELPDFLKVMHCLGQEERGLASPRSSISIFSALSPRNRAAWPGTPAAVDWLSLMAQIIQPFRTRPPSLEAIGLAAELLSLILEHSPPPFEELITLYREHHPSLEELHRLLTPHGLRWQDRLRIFEAQRNRIHTPLPDQGQHSASHNHTQNYVSHVLIKLQERYRVEVSPRAAQQATTSLQEMYRHLGSQFYLEQDTSKPYLSRGEVVSLDYFFHHLSFSNLLQERWHTISVIVVEVLKDVPALAEGAGKPTLTVEELYQIRAIWFKEALLRSQFAYGDYDKLLHEIEKQQQEIDRAREPTTSWPTALENTHVRSCADGILNRCIVTLNSFHPDVKVVEQDPISLVLSLLMQASPQQRQILRSFDSQSSQEQMLAFLHALGAREAIPLDAKRLRETFQAYIDYYL